MWLAGSSRRPRLHKPLFPSSCITHHDYHHTCFQLLSRPASQKWTFGARFFMACMGGGQEKDDFSSGVAFIGAASSLG